MSPRASGAPVALRTRDIADLAVTEEAVFQGIVAKAVDALKGKAKAA